MIRDPRTDSFLVDHRLRAYAASRPDHLALVVGQRRVTYAELDAAADAWANMLHGLGVARGDRVVLALDNGYEAVAGFYGSLRADAIPSLVGAGRRSKRLQRIVELAEPRVLVTTAKVAQAMNLELARGCRVVVVDNSASGPVRELPPGMAAELATFQRERGR
jgi:long-chain acyl-CoA synthetase